MTKMKGITCCGDCGYYSWKKHKCTRATDEGDARSNFYADCPLPDVVPVQAPRVMTLEEVKDFNWDYCYLEEERLPGKEYRAVCGDYALTCITWPSVTSMRIQHGDESYGKEWRCWTSRPDKATREATPWNV